MSKDAFSKASLPATAAALVTRLSSEGWSQFATPHDGTKVFMKGDMVVRLNKGNDLGFVNYAELCLYHPSQHLLNVSWHSHMEDGSHVTLSERLIPATPDRAAPKDVRSTLRALWRLGNVINHYSPEELKTIGNPSLPDLSEEPLRHDASYISALMDDIQAQSPSLAEALKLVCGRLSYLNSVDSRYVGNSADLAPGNILLRPTEDGKHVIVLSDPFAYDIYSFEPAVYSIERYALPSDPVLTELFPAPDLPGLKIHTYRPRLSNG